jgi:hypothetical protein
MRTILVAAAVAAVAACTPPSAPAPEASGSEEAAAPAPAPEPGPYANSWDSDDFSRFQHTLQAPSGGPHTLTLTATTNSPGGETVAVYLAGPGGEPSTGWRMFVVATTRGETATEVLEFPDGGVQPVVVVIENASGQRLAGSYTLSVVP